MTPSPAPVNIINKLQFFENFPYLKYSTLRYQLSKQYSLYIIDNIFASMQQLPVCHGKIYIHSYTVYNINYQNFQYST